MANVERCLSVADILRLYAAGERDFRELDVVSDGDTFENKRLDGADFSSSFVDASFAGAGLRGARFVNANVKACTFDRADLSGATFEGAALYREFSAPAQPSEAADPGAAAARLGQALADAEAFAVDANVGFGATGSTTRGKSLRRPVRGSSTTPTCCQPRLTA